MFKMTEFRPQIFVLFVGLMLVALYSVRTGLEPVAASAVTGAVAVGLRMFEGRDG